MTSACEPKSNVDLNAFTQEFLTFEQTYGRQQQENVCLAAENERLKQRLVENQAKYRHLQEDVRSADSTVATLQRALNNRCDSEDKIRKLVEEIECLNTSIDSQKKELEADVLRHEKQMSELEEKHKNEQDKLKQELHAQAEKEMKEWRRITEAQEQTIEQLKRRVTALEKDKQAELVKLRIDYDLKLTKLQNEHAQSVQANSSAVNKDRELYRKKLQQARADSQREVSELKSAVASLRQQLAFYEHPPPRAAGRSARFTNR